MEERPTGAPHFTQTTIDEGPAPFRKAFRPITPSAGMTPAAMFPRTEIAHNVFACNGYLGAGPAQRARLFLQMLEAAEIGLVVTVCKWAAAESVTPLLSSKGIRHVLLKEDAASISSWMRIKAALDAILKTSASRRVLLNGFAHTPETAMVGVALLVYSNVPVAAAIAKVEPFYAGIRDVCRSSRASSPYRCMLEMMEQTRRDDPYINQVPEVVSDEDDDGAAALRRKRPRRIYVPESETRPTGGRDEPYMTLRERKPRPPPERGSTRNARAPRDGRDVD